MPQRLAHAAVLALIETQNAIATSELDLDAVMAIVAREARTLTGADAAVVELPDGDDLVYRAVAGTAEPYLGFRLRAATAISGLALLLDETLVCDDAETDDRVDRDACRSVGARSMLVVPLRHGGRAAGVLKVYSGRASAFDEAHVTIVALLADMIGAALHRAELMEKLDQLARTDDLTGLPNRRNWHEQLERAVARARRSGEPLTVVVLDLNGFKRINDVEGQAAGDRLLRESAAAWSAVLRETDTLGRIGGHEFAVVLEKTDADAAVVVGRLVASLPLPGAVSVAAGIATWDEVEDAESLLARADAAMYAEKRPATRE